MLLGCWGGGWSDDEEEKFIRLRIEISCHQPHTIFPSMTPVLYFTNDLGVLCTAFERR